MSEFDILLSEQLENPQFKQEWEKNLPEMNAIRLELDGRNLQSTQHQNDAEVQQQSTSV